MFCIVSFIVLSILGIFSASNRQLAQEALGCVFRRVTFRPCNTGFDVKMKSKILGKVINRSERLARFLNKYFEVLAWIFFLVFLASFAFAIRGLYLFYVSGSCNGLNQSGFCVFDPTGKNNQVSSVQEGCPVIKVNEGKLSLNGIDLTNFPIENATSTDKIVFIGSYGCDYTRQAYPLVKAMAEKYHTSFEYLDYPTKETSDLLSRVGYVVYQQNQTAYWKLNDILFATDKTNLADETFIQKTLDGLGLNGADILTQASSRTVKDTVTAQLTTISNTNFYGTPTVFINGKGFVGPKPYRVYVIQLRGLFFWL